jgi:iron complex transport system substrate-binding protein
VALATRPAQRIVSLCPSNTEILFALGLGDRVVAVDNDSDYPPAATRLPKVGPDLDVDIAKVAAAEPDLVVASLSVPGMERNLLRLESAGLPYIVLHSQRLDEIYRDIQLVADLAGVPERGAALVADLQARFAALAERAKVAANRPRLYWEWWPKPLITPGRPSWITDLSTLANATNAFADLPKESDVITSDDVIARDPDVVLICWCGARRAVSLDKIVARPGWDRIRAVREGRVHVVWEGLFGRPGPRLVEGFAWLVRAAHPELFGPCPPAAGFPA